MANRNSHQVQQLLGKMTNPDADFRFMALNDLISECSRSDFSIDESTETKTVEQVLDLMNDGNGEVKNLAVRTIATLSKRVSESHMQTILDRLIGFTSVDPKKGAQQDQGAKEQLRDVAGLALKTVVGEVQPGSKTAQLVVNKLLPKLLAQVSNPSSSPDLLISSTDLLSDIFLRFDSMIKSSSQSSTQLSSLNSLTTLLKLPDLRGAVKKRVSNALANLIHCSSKDIFEKLIEDCVVPGLKGGGGVEEVRVCVALVGNVARTSPKRVSKKINVLVPATIAAEKSKDDDELRDAVLQTLETLLLKCPTEITPYISQITEVGLELIKYDPNYAGDDMDEDVDMDADEEEEQEEEDDDEDFGDEYSDDDDLSWKVRRAATKLLSAAISTRPELLSYFYRTVSPVLISRFSEREESVRVEIWASYTTLLEQTSIWGSGNIQLEKELTTEHHQQSLKRKRDAEISSMDVEEGPLTLLKAQVGNIAKSIIKQLSAKSVQTRQAGFGLLHQLISVLPQGLDGYISPLIIRIESALKSTDTTGVSGTATNLKIDVLRFLALLFKTHQIKSFQDHLEKIVPLLVGSIGDKFHKIASETFQTLVELVRVLRPVSLPSQQQQQEVLTVTSNVPVGSEGLVVGLYNATYKRLNASDTDTEVKEKGITALGELLFHTGDLLSSQIGLEQSLNLLKTRLGNEVTRFVTVGVVNKVVKSPVLGGDEVFLKWVRECLVEVAGFLRKNNRPLRLAAFGCVTACLERCGTQVPASDYVAILVDLEPLLTDVDLTLLPMAIITAGTILTLHPTLDTNTRTQVLNRIYTLTHSSSVQGPALNALVDFFAKLVDAGDDAWAIVKQLTAGVDVKGLDQLKLGASAVGVQSYYTTSRCIGAVVAKSPATGDQVITEFSNAIANSQSPAGAVFFSLLALGEVGRTVDFANHDATYKGILGAFSHSVEDLRGAAAFAAGNIAVGNPGLFLPVLLDQVQKDDKKRYLSLTSLKEFITHLSPSVLTAYADQLWVPLFDNGENEEEGTRNLAAECLGKLTLSDPGEYLPKLQERLKAPSARTRSTVIAAVRFTLVDDSAPFDDALAPSIVHFLSLLQDPDLDVRRLALSTLNSAAHNKPHLIKDYLSTLLPQLYAKTNIDPTLIRIVEMGPFKHKVDDGLDVRKSAYECMYTFLDTFLNKIDLNQFMSRVLAGISDEDEIKVLCYLMLIKLADIAPAVVSQHLDATAGPFSEVLAQKPKDNAVKQEIEKIQELQKSAYRCIARLSLLASGGTPKFSQLVAQVQLSSHKETFRELVNAHKAASTR